MQQAVQSTHMTMGAMATACIIAFSFRVGEITEAEPESFTACPAVVDAMMLLLQVPVLPLAEE